MLEGYSLNYKLDYTTYGKINRWVNLKSIYRRMSK
jgi:hypothetical protein